MTEPTNGTGARLYHLERRQDKVEPTVNQLTIDVALIRQDVRSIADDIRVMREEVEKRDERDTTTVRWRVGTAIAIVMAILAAAAIVSGAIQSGTIL